MNALTPLNRAPSPVRFADGASRRRPRILFVINSLAGGGAERVMTTLLANSTNKSRRFEIALAVLDNDSRAFDLPAWLKVFQLDCRGGTVSSILGLERLVRDYDPDISLSFLTRSNIASGIAMVKRRRPWIISERTSTSAHLGNGPRQFVTKSLIRLVYPRASRVIAVSSGVATKLCQSFAVPEARIEVISNPVDREALEAAAAKSCDLGLGDPYIIAVGRLVAVKNYALLVQAFAKAKLACKLVIAGDGPERDALAKLGAELGLEDRLVLPGWLANPYPALKRASVFALSSNVEGFPNALVEALALGVPSVATNCSDGPAEILAGSSVDAVSGLSVADAGILTPVGDVDLYAKALRTAFEPGLRERLIASGQARAKDYSAGSIARRYWELIEGQLEQAQARRAS